MRLTKNFKLAWNGFFLVMALFFCGLLMVVFFFPAIINNFGETHKQSYISQHQQLAKQAVNSLNQGNTAPLQDLLRNDLSQIKKGDRLYPLKRDLLLTLVQQFHEQKKPSWISWAQEWYRLDQRDVTAMVYYYAALLQDEQQYEKGLQGLKEASQRFPKHPILNQIYQAEVSRTALSED